MIRAMKWGGTEKKARKYVRKRTGDNTLTLLFVTVTNGKKVRREGEKKKKGQE